MENLEILQTSLETNSIGSLVLKIALQIAHVIWDNIVVGFFFFFQFLYTKLVKY